MGSRAEPAVLAIVLAAVAGFLLFMPYIARQYRRRGELRTGNMALDFAWLLYCCGLISYVLFPFPDMTPEFCAVFGRDRPELMPLGFLRHMRRESFDTDLMATLRDPAVTPVLLNIALFIPLGMFLRHLFRRGMLTTTIIGLGVSLLIELTQLTGIWFLYPCAYRLFEVDDLITNTLGTVLGALAAPALRAVPGQRITAAPGVPRPVTWSRRLLAAGCDLMIFEFSRVLITAGGTVLLMTWQGALFSGEAVPYDELADNEVLEFAATWLPWFVLAAVVPLAGSGASLGQWVVHLRPATTDGRRPSATARLARSLAGTGGYLLLAEIDTFATWAFLVALASLVGLFTTARHRGLSCYLTRLTMADARTSARPNDTGRVSGLTAER